VTATDQDEAATRFTHYIDRILTPFVPDASRWSVACQIVQAARDEHWRCVPPAPNVLDARRAGDPPTPEFLAAKAAITRKEDPNA
jgi:hypothetical protein